METMFVHILVTCIIACGACLFWHWPSLLLAHMVLNILVILQWLVNNNRCIMSGEYKDDAGYSQDLIRRLTGREVSTQISDTVAYVVTLGALVASGTAYLIKTG